MLTAGFGLSVPLPGMVPQHVLSSAQVSDAHIAHSADEETTAEEAALAAEAAESAAESAAAMVTAVLEVAAARQKVSQAEKAMVTALREAFADAWRKLGPSPLPGGAGGGATLASGADSADGMGGESP